MTDDYIAGYRKAIEDAAKAAEEWGLFMLSQGMDERAYAAGKIVNVIRALVPKD